VNKFCVANRTRFETPAAVFLRGGNDDPAVARPQVVHDIRPFDLRELEHRLDDRLWRRDVDHIRLDAGCRLRRCRDDEAECQSRGHERWEQPSHTPL
jgi:hypothetical protein